MAWAEAEDSVTCSPSSEPRSRAAGCATKWESSHKCPGRTNCIVQPERGKQTKLHNYYRFIYQDKSLQIITIHYLTISSQGATKATFFRPRIYNYLPKITAMLFAVVWLFLFLFLLFSKSLGKVQTSERQRQRTPPSIIREKGRPRTGKGYSNLHVHPSSAPLLPAPSQGLKHLISH